jgi:hypothetical protein
MPPALFAEGLAAAFFDFDVELLGFFVRIVELLSFLREDFTLARDGAFLIEELLPLER